MPAIITPILAILVLCAILEALYLHVVKKQRYDWRESLASLGVALMGRLVQVASVWIVITAADWVWLHRCYTLDSQQAGYWPLLFLLQELCYYAFHRISHQYRWFWATHVVHHTPRHFYLSGAYRLGWTGPLTGGFVFFMPLVAIGFQPISVFTVLGLNLLYQFWLHTELVGSLGGFDRIFNSPSNHRVHHATQTVYLDKNFGGVLMLFDHLFGTYQAEKRDDPIKVYGVLPGFESYNPVKIALNEWLRIAVDLKNQRGFKNRFGVLFGKP